MKERLAFGVELRSARLRAGHRSAYAFHKARRRELGISFVNYLPLERGNTLPRPRRLPALLAALGLRAGTPGARTLLRAYARAHLGAPALYEALGLVPEKRGPDAREWDLLERYSRGTRAGRTAHLAMEQYRAIAADADAYACNAILVNTKPGLSEEALAAESGLSVVRARGAAKRLAAAGLAERAGKLWRSPLRDKVLAGAPRSAAFAAVQARFDAHRAKWAAARGRGAHKTYLLVRGRGRDMRLYFDRLDEAVNLSSAYGDARPGPDSALWLVEAAVSRLS